MELVEMRQMRAIKVYASRVIYSATLGFGLVFGKVGLAQESAGWSWQIVDETTSARLAADGANLIAAYPAESDGFQLEVSFWESQRTGVVYRCVQRIPLSNDHVSFCARPFRPFDNQ